MESVDSKTNLDKFLGELGAGVFKDKIALALSEVAMGTSVHGNGGKKGKVIISFSITRVNDFDQVMITHKLQYETPTPRGSKTQNDTTNTPMFVGKHGKLTLDQPREDSNGQNNMFGLNGD